MLAESGGSFESETEITRPPTDSRIQSLFLDHSAAHLLINLQHPNGFETHYVHESWRSSRPLVRMRGVSICAVGWRWSAPPEREKGKPSVDLRVREDPHPMDTRYYGSMSRLFLVLVSCSKKRTLNSN